MINHQFQLRGKTRAALNAGVMKKRIAFSPSDRILVGALLMGVVLAGVFFLIFPYALKAGYWWAFPVLTFVIAAVAYPVLLDNAAKQRIIDGPAAPHEAPPAAAPGRPEPERQAPRLGHS
jgi:hypothetical protein